MSRQVIDSISRSVRQASDLIDKQNYKKAFSILEKAEQRAHDENIIDFIPPILILKGKIFEASNEVHEALDLYEESFLLSSEFFLKEPDIGQDPLTSSLMHLSSILAETEDMFSAEIICENNEGLFSKIHDAYNELIADNPEDIEYLMNYSNSLECIIIICIVAQEAESRITMMADAMDAYANIIKLAPEDLDIPILLHEMVEQYANSCLANESIEEAKQTYENLIEIDNAILKREPERMDVLKLLADSYGLMADLYFYIDELENAQIYYAKAIDILESQLQRASDESPYLLAIGKMYHKTGMLFLEQDDHTKSRSYYERSLEVLERTLGKQQKSPDILEECSDLFEDLADSLINLELLEEAKTCYTHQIEIYNSLIDAGIDRTENQIYIAETYRQIAGLYSSEKDIENAKLYFQKGISVYEELLLEDPDEISYEVSIANTLTSLGSLHFRNKETEAAKVYYEKALSVYERIKADGQDYIEFAPNHAKTLQYLAELYDSKEQYEDAIPLLHQAAEFLEELESKVPENWMLLQNLGIIYQLLGDLYDDLGDEEKSAHYHSHALELISKVLFDETCVGAVKNLLGFTILTKGSYYLHNGKYNIAGPYLELCRNFYEYAYEEDASNPDSIMCLSDVLHDLGVLDYNTGLLKEAIEKYMTSLALMEDLLKTSPEDLDILDNVAIMYTRIGAAHCVAGDLEQSKQAFEQAENIRTTIIEKDPDYPFETEWEITHLEEYSKLLEKMGMSEEAARYRTKAEEKSRAYEIES